MSGFTNEVFAIFDLPKPIEMNSLRLAILGSLLLVAAQLIAQNHHDHSQCNHSSCGLVALQESMNTRIGPPADFVPGNDRSAIINVTYNGFSPQAEAAFQYAVDIWASEITSSVPIVVNANWVALAPGVLGSAGPGDFSRDFAGAPQSLTFYPAALANSITNGDLSPFPDIDCNFNSNFANWYFGTDGLCPANQYDFVTVVLHELCHGLGFVGSASYSAPNGFLGIGVPTYPVVYDQFVELGSGLDVTDLANPGAALGSALVGEDLWWHGSFGALANFGTRPRLFAPNSWIGGSSFSHVDETTFPAGDPNSLMTYALGMGEAIHNPGPVVLGMFEDMGWELGNGGCTDPLACNYDPNALEDNGLCNYSDALWYLPVDINNPALPAIYTCNSVPAGYVEAVYQDCVAQIADLHPYCALLDWDQACENAYINLVGCTDPQACNYNPAAVCDDQSCILPGCTDPEACNFDPNAACSGDCLYFDCAGVCGGFAEINGCGVCDDPSNLAVYQFTGEVQTFVVPEDVSQLFIQAFGAQGGGSEVCLLPPQEDGGWGGYASGYLSVNPGDILYVYVGGKGQMSGNGGFNGGGNGGLYAGGGGGASDVRTFFGDLNSRLIVAGGGGGGNTGCPEHGAGGAGGGLVGGDGIVGIDPWLNAGGGTQVAGGTAGAFPGGAGMFGQGASSVGNPYHIAGGGGGWYGGGSAYASGAGGGSSFLGGVINGSTNSGVREGDGLVLISYGGLGLNCGCVDPQACNFNPDADTDDGSCVYPGCMDAEACNYMPDAGCEAACLYVDCAGVCGGSYIEDECGNCFDPDLEATIGFSYTGDVQEWVVPEGVTSIRLEAWGAVGGESFSCTEGPNPQFDGGLGGYAAGDLAVVPGQTLYLYVGGKGGIGYDGPFEGGWNGGGNGGYWAGGGGGASDIRTIPNDLNSRVLVAGGGGGGNTGCPNHGTGGNGGGLSGDPGIQLFLYFPAGGGDQVQGGAAGYDGAPGSFGYGGSTESYHHAGGGGGWYGGGSAYAAGGGGGSSYIGGVLNGSTVAGVNADNGRIVISYDFVPDCILGCTDPTACNYNPAATIDDGSCGCPCDEISVDVAYQDAQGNPGECCASLSYNLDYPGIIGLAVHTSDSEIALNLASVSPQLSVYSSSPNEFSLSAVIPGQNIPQGALQDFVSFCLENTINPVQTVYIDWYDANAHVVCSDSIVFHCPVEPDCLYFTQDSVYCDGTSTYYEVQLCNPADAPFSVGFINLLLSGAPGLTLSATSLDLGNNPILPGDCINWVLEVLGDNIGGSSFCAQFVAHENNPEQVPNGVCCTFAESSCVDVPICDPCEAVAVESLHPLDGGDCCYQIEISNDFAPDYFDEVQLLVLSPGTTFTINNPFNSGWLSAGYTGTSVSLLPADGFVELGNSFLPPVCIDTDIAPEQFFLLNWMQEGEVMCSDTIAFHCEPDCGYIYDENVYCDPETGGWYVQLVLKNTSDFIVSEALVSFSDPGMSIYNQTIPTGPMNPGDLFGPYLFQVGAPAVGGSDLCFTVTMHEVNAEGIYLSCCNFNHCIALPVCEEPYVCLCDEDFYNGVAMGIDCSFSPFNSMAFTFSLTGAGEGLLGECDEGRWTFGDQTSQLFFDANASVTHTYVNGGIYTVCAKVRRVDANGQICKTGVCKEITVLSPESPDPDMIAVYPNPTEGNFNVKVASGLLEEGVYLTILDNTGRIVNDVLVVNPINNSLIQIDMGTHAKGIYTLHFQSRERSVMRRVVIH